MYTTEDRLRLAGLITTVGAFFAAIAVTWREIRKLADS